MRRSRELLRLLTEQVLCLNVYFSLKITFHAVIMGQEAKVTVNFSTMHA